MSLTSKKDISDEQESVFTQRHVFFKIRKNNMPTIPSRDNNPTTCNLNKFILCKLHTHVPFFKKTQAIVQCSAFGKYATSEHTEKIIPPEFRLKLKLHIVQPTQTSRQTFATQDTRSSWLHIHLFTSSLEHFLTGFFRNEIESQGT